MAGGSDGGQGVGAVVLAQQSPTHSPLLSSREADAKGFGVQRFDLPAAAGSKILNGGPATLAQYPRQRRIHAVGDEKARSRNGSNEMMKLLLDRSKIGEHVCVIELEVIQNRSFWVVMNKLGTLVEKSGVVFVSFDHKKPGIGQTGGSSEILRHATDKKARVLAGCLQDPRQHGGGGRFAVGAGDCEHPLSLQYVFCQPLRAGGIRLPTVEDFFDQGGAAGDDVADHPQVGLQADLLGAVTFDQRNALRLELAAHRRIDIGIAAGYLVSSLSRDGGDAAHESTANAENVDVHARNAWSFGPSLIAAWQQICWPERTRGLADPV